MRETAQRYPQRTAIRSQGQAITFAEFDRLSSRLANGFAALGVRAGDRIALFLPNGSEYEVGFYAGSKLGAISCPVNPSYRDAELVTHFDEFDVTLVLSHSMLMPVLEVALRRCRRRPAAVVVGDGVLPTGMHQYTSVLSAASDRLPDVNVDPEAVAALPYSSGTTGFPKGVMLTHRNLVANHIQYGIGCRLTAEDRFLVYVPLSHIYGVALMGLAMRAGVEQIIVERFDVSTLGRLVEAHRITWLHVVPPVLRALAESPDLERKQFRTVKYAQNAAAPLVADVARRVTERLGFPVVQAYGLTEASPCTHLSPLDQESIKVESVGVPLVDTEHRIVDVETGKRTLAAGERGEIVVRGPQVMRGYWNAPEETATALRDGWLYTGDIGWIDDEGYAYVADRKKDMIKYKSFSIAPAELEAVLLQHPDVADCAVAAVPDAEAGEVPKAFVVARQGCPIDTMHLAEYVCQRVAGYKHIRRWAIVENIPRTPSGKLLRRALR